MQQLKARGITANLDIIEINIELDNTIAAAAAATLREKYGKLDVLVNNAVRLDIIQSDDLSIMRAASNGCFNNGITSNIIMTHAFTPLLRNSGQPRVVMVSSIRGSLTRTARKEVRETGPCINSREGEGQT
ncbi:hypothetical protein PCL_00004 [Purpureocillium lilacinum]|uniref:Short chain dehydrogenase domain-containing protein n=1 Tax=Purpureocillium lilacinum TaxID=33203 RepID=A0A2U3DPA6_PURLI|nr:hypothetical protein PCL_00004 [Purpureocillium lilacinum]